MWLQNVLSSDFGLLVSVFLLYVDSVFANSSLPAFLNLSVACFNSTAARVYNCRGHMDRLISKLHKLPIAVLGIITINIVVTILTLHTKSAPRDYGLLPSQFLTGKLTVAVGRLFTSTFIHDGFVHLGINMTLLYVFGRSLERTMGRLEFLMFYIGACFAGSIAHVAIVMAALPPYYSTLPVVGASGAVAGVMGMYLVRFHRKMVAFCGLDTPVLVLIMGWMVLQLGLGILGLYRDSIFGVGLKLVSYWSHLGGVAFGIAVALIANMALQGEREYLISEEQRNYKEGNLLEAIRNCEAILKYDPDNAFAYTEIGRLWAILEEEEQSLHNYQVGIELYLHQGKEQDAFAAAEEMKRFWPRASLSATTQFKLATCLEESCEIARAIQTLRHIIEKYPDSTEAQMSLIKIGHLQMTFLEDHASANTTLTDFITRYPDSEWNRFAEEVRRGNGVG